MAWAALERLAADAEWLGQDCGLVNADLEDGADGGEDVTQLSAEGVAAVASHRDGEDGVTWSRDWAKLTDTGKKKACLPRRRTRGLNRDLEVAALDNGGGFGRGGAAAERCEEWERGAEEREETRRVEAVAHGMPFVRTVRLEDLGKGRRT